MTAYDYNPGPVERFMDRLIPALGTAALVFILALSMVGLGWCAYTAFDQAVLRWKIAQACVYAVAVGAGVWKFRVER